MTTGSELQQQVLAWQQRVLIQNEPLRNTEGICSLVLLRFIRVRQNFSWWLAIGEKHVFSEQFVSVNHNCLNSIFRLVKLKSKRHFARYEIMTSLAQQLKQLAIPQTQVLLGDDTRKASFLYDPKKAASIDRETFFCIGEICTYVYLIHIAH